MKIWCKICAGILLTSLLGILPAAQLARASTWDDVHGAASYAEALADIIRTVSCNQANLGHYYDLSNQGQVSNDVLNAALSALGPWGLATEMSKDSAAFLSNELVGSYLDAGESAFESEMSAYQGGTGVTPDNINNFLQDLQVKFTSGIQGGGFEGAAIADAALATYGSLVANVPADQIGQYVADNRTRMENGQLVTQPLETGLKLMMLRELQNKPQEWNNSSVQNFVWTLIGDKWGIANLSYWAYQQVLTLHCPPNPPVHQSLDPNDITASPAGIGPSQWIQGTQRIIYTIRFENEAAATASAVNIRVAATLDPSLDPSTVQPGSSSFAGAVFSFDTQTGQLTWTLPNINLPPDTSPPNGEGWVSFSALPKSGLANGTEVSESADVYFDYNPPIETNTATSTLDTVPPVVTLTPLSAQVSSPVALQWTSSSLAGVDNYAVYLAFDGGALALMERTNATSDTFGLAKGHSYSVAVVATDITGLTSSSVAQATFAVGSSGQGGGGGSSGSGGSPPSAGLASVGPAGGSLETPDGIFQANVHAGAVPDGSTFSVSEAHAPPPDAPPLVQGHAVESPFFTLAGDLTQPVTVSFGYYPAVLGGISPYCLSIYADGAWHSLPTSVDSASRRVSAKVSGATTLVLLAATQTFTDVSEGYWAAASIDRLLAAGVVAGRADGSFRPDAVLTRAEFVKMLALTLGLQPGTGTHSFTDVKSGDWFAPYVDAAVSSGLVQGVTPKRFDPAGILTREQIALLVTRAMQLTGGAPLTFSDTGQIDASAVAAVRAAVGAGYLQGFPDGSFRPQGTVTRAEAAKVMAAVLAHLGP